MARAGQALDPLQKWSLHETLGLIDNARLKDGQLAAQHPLRCISHTIGAEASSVQPYCAGEQYMAVSYTWPGGWQRLYTSLLPSLVVRNGKRGLSKHVSIFMTVVFDFVLATRQYDRLFFWVDHACINQDDETEKAQQVAAMDRIYTQARMTIVLLEDIELTTEEFSTLNRMTMPKSSEERKRLLTLTRRIMSARWFERAWCSQEMILSHHSSFSLHRTDEPTKPITFPVATLVNWLNRARIYEPNIPWVPEPRGHIDYTRLQPMASSPYAWAYGVVHSMKCYNVYDKIALVQHLVRMPPESRLTLLPDSSGVDVQMADFNVAKVINALAVQNGDYSLLQTGHTADSAELQVEHGFSWAGIPTRGDIVSNAWHGRRQYEVDRDKDVALTSSGLRLSGLLAVSLSRLKDILYAIEAFDADHIWPTFMPADGNWITRGPNDGTQSEWHEPLRNRIWKEYNRPAMVHRSTAQAVEFCHHGSVTTFRELTVDGGVTMIVAGNAPDVDGKQIFQPFVMRLKEFGSDRNACNVIVLQDADARRSGDVRRCGGHLRSFQLLPDSAKLQTITLQ
ncbi:hypothetical protein LTR37_014445 [Vermiconidia calcicola]|uniref:Uncharacterized protein n=1 Tax=Vermiconidia calcicola TaxID=1690605 RepID=A0ACC3MTJ2_9PEZI|nr:hypothetical protein LTR37_014445 [Vermiconidia calcicola]